MIELLERAAAAQPEHTCLQTPRGTSTYAQLLRQARIAAAGLRARGIERFALLDDDPARVLAVLAGSSLVGAEACVYPLAASPELVAEHRKRFDHDVCVTGREMTGAPGVLATDDLLAHEPVAEPIGVPDARPVMVMSTGTSGDPKGVLHDWGRLLAPTGRLVPTPEQRWLLAFGLNQFGGLQILLHVLAARATLVAAEVISPKSGLAVMREQGVTHASGTPTFWRFLLAELEADGGPVPPLRQVTLSGEAVPDDLLARVRSTFPDARLSQIYAATEFGQGVSVRDGGVGLPAALLEAEGDLALRIVDGELHVRSSTSMLGYYGQEDDAPDGWRPTGDLVELVGDRIEFRGRTSEVINVGGIKVHPLPVEQRIGALPGVAAARVFGRPNKMVGAIVAVEVVPAAGTDPEALDAEIRAACADLPPAARPRNIRMVEELTTAQHKIVRRSDSE